MVFYPEKLLQFIWRCRLYSRTKLQSTAGQVIEVLDPGVWNQDAGPDFLHARLRIDHLLWVGNVEIHQHPKQWHSHGHQHNRQYDNVILHVVWSGQEPVSRKDGSGIPTLELKDYLDEILLRNYEGLWKAKTWIPCAAQLSTVPRYLHAQVLDRMLRSRLEDKNREVQMLLKHSANDWERVTKQLLAQSFGTKVNKEAFMRLFTTFPTKLLDLYHHDRLKLEALLFGQAGFLTTETRGRSVEPSNPDDYFLALQTEYRHLRQLHQLTPMGTHEWKFLRMRPANFPTLRIAQLAAWIHAGSTLFHMIIQEKDIHTLIQRFKAIEASDYWKDHYHFRGESARHSTKMTASFLKQVSINCFAVLRYAYGQYTRQEKLQQEAMQWLQQLSAEKNRIIDQFAQHGVTAEHAADSQALLQLYRHQCEKKACLSCAIGYHIIGYHNIGGKGAIDG